MRNNQIRACNSILAAINKSYHAIGLHVDLPEKGVETQLNGLFINSGVQRMFQAKSFINVDRALSILAGFNF